MRQFKTFKAKGSKLRNWHNGTPCDTVSDQELPSLHAKAQAFCGQLMAGGRCCIHDMLDGPCNVHGGWQIVR